MSWVVIYRPRAGAHRCESPEYASELAAQRMTESLVAQGVPAVYVDATECKEAKRLAFEAGTGVLARKTMKAVA